MTRLEIINFYRSYKKQVLSEMTEHMDKPLQNLSKLDDKTYLVSEDELQAEYKFTKQQIYKNLLAIGNFL